jgi:hypothetical protein
VNPTIVFIEALLEFLADPSQGEDVNGAKEDAN